MASIEILLLAFVTIFMAVAALEVEKLSRAIVCLATSSVGIGLIFLYLGAFYAAMLELVIYAGVLIILFMITASFVEEEEPEETIIE